MPSGYTDAIKDDITFEQFTMNCARAMGACVTLRDEPGGGEGIPDSFEPSSYYQEKLAEDVADLEALDGITPDRCVAEATALYEASEAGRLERLSVKRKLEEKYRAMLARVEGWTPPTDEHIGLKQFMSEQITGSIDFDCDTSYSETKTVAMTGEEWLATRVESLKKSIKYRTKEHAEEVKRAADRTTWIKDLRSSLGIA